MLQRHMDSPAHPSPAVFRYRAYSLFWAARVFTTLAVQAQSVTIGWQVYTLARRGHGVEQSALLVGMVGLVQFLPLFALTFVAGAVADRRDRRSIVLICLGTELLAVLALAALALHPAVSLLPIFSIAAVFGASRAFLGPAQGAMGPMLVPREVLPRAIAWNSLGYQSAGIIGPWIGGALCAISPMSAYLGSAALYLVAILSLAALRANTRPAGTGASRMELIREGVHYVWTNKIVLGAISLDLFAVLLGGATALLPVYARDVLRIGAHGFGVLRSGPAIGAALMAVALSRWQIHRHAGRWMFAGVAAFGLATLVFAVSKLLWVSVAGPGGARGGGHDLGLCPPVAGPDRDAGRHARPGLRGVGPVHRRVQRARGVRDGCGGAGDRPRGRGAVRRLRIAGGYGTVGAAVPGLAAGRQAGQPGD